MALSKASKDETSRFMNLMHEAKAKQMSLYTEMALGQRSTDCPSLDPKNLRSREGQYESLNDEYY